MNTSTEFSRRCQGIVASLSVLLTGMFFSRHVPASVTDALMYSGSIVATALFLAHLFYRFVGRPLNEHADPGRVELP